MRASPSMFEARWENIRRSVPAAVRRAPGRIRGCRQRRNQSEQVHRFDGRFVMIERGDQRAGAHQIASAHDHVIGVVALQLATYAAK